MAEYSIMTMNMQTDNPMHPFNQRAGAIQAVIRRYDPDLIGSQELTDEMVPCLKDLTDEYALYGDSRHSLIADEHNFIFYKKERFDLLSSKTLWLSSTPFKPGSRFPFAFFPRIVSFVILKDKTSGTVLSMFNTHLDHINSHVRSQQAQVLTCMILKYGVSDCILTGDFNTITGTRPLSLIAESGMHDCIRDDIGTTMRHLPEKYDNKPIDHIFLSSSLKADSIQKVTMNFKGTYPSDHYPVLAEISS